MACHWCQWIEWIIKVNDWVIYVTWQAMMYNMSNAWHSEKYDVIMMQDTMQEMDIIYPKELSCHQLVPPNAKRSLSKERTPARILGIYVLGLLKDYMMFLRPLILVHVQHIHWDWEVDSGSMNCLCTKPS